MQAFTAAQSSVTAPGNKIGVEGGSRAGGLKNDPLGVWDGKGRINIA